jgi:hypothetical protein
LFGYGLVNEGTLLDPAVGMAEQGFCTAVDPGAAGIDRDHCIQNAAIRKSDPDLCKDIEYPPPRTKCVMLIAEKEGNKAICEQMEDHPGPGEYSRLECLQRVAVKTGDSSVCDLMGTATVSYMFTGEVSKATCYEKVGTAGSPSLQQIYNKDKENFEYCQDLAYAQIFHKPPPSSEGLSAFAKSVQGGQRKAEVGDALNTAYKIEAQGYVVKGSAPSIDLRDGDIIVFGFDSYPDPKNAPHYAVAESGKILQVLAWGQGGSLDQPRDPAWFFNTRTVTNPYTGETSTSPKVYQYYIQYRKK